MPKKPEYDYLIIEELKEGPQTGGTLYDKTKNRTENKILPEKTFKEGLIRLLNKKKIQVLGYDTEYKFGIDRVQTISYKPLIFAVLKEREVFEVYRLLKECLDGLDIHLEDKSSLRKWKNSYGELRRLFHSKISETLNFLKDLESHLYSKEIDDEILKLIYYTKKEDLDPNHPYYLSKHIHTGAPIHPKILEQLREGCKGFKAWYFDEKFYKEHRHGLPTVRCIIFPENRKKLVESLNNTYKEDHSSYFYLTDHSMIDKKFKQILFYLAVSNSNLLNYGFAYGLSDEKDFQGWLDNFIDMDENLRGEILKKLGI